MADIERWMSLHYSESAEEVAHDWRLGRVSEVELVRHSLRKWQGLGRDYLLTFGLTRDARGVVEFDNPNSLVLAIDAGSCSLCQAYDPLPKRTCAGCPLYASRGNVPCDKPRMGYEAISPWAEWSRYKNPEPMVSALKSTLLYMGQRLIDDL